jgi:hypothetical protein
MIRKGVIRQTFPINQVMITGLPGPFPQHLVRITGLPVFVITDNQEITPHRLIFYIDSGPFRHSSNQFDIGCSLFTFNSLSGGVTNRLMMR